MLHPSKLWQLASSIFKDFKFCGSSKSKIGSGIDALISEVKVGSLFPIYCTHASCSCKQPFCFAYLKIYVAIGYYYLLLL